MTGTGLVAVPVNNWKKTVHTLKLKPIDPFGRYGVGENAGIFKRLNINTGLQQHIGRKQFPEAHGDLLHRCRVKTRRYRRYGRSSDLPFEYVVVGGVFKWYKNHKRMPPACQQALDGLNVTFRQNKITEITPIPKGNFGGIPYL